MASPVGPHEEERLQVLLGTGIVASPSDPILDAICQAAKHHFGVPISLITLVDLRKLWMKASQGFCRSEMPRDAAFCNYTILSNAVFIINDMLVDERFKDNPLVTGEPYLRFYAGAPLVYLKDIRLGSLCLLDTKPRTFSLGDKAELNEMADRVVAQIMSRELAANNLVPSVVTLTLVSHGRPFPG
ncbi:GAF domain-containing protein [Microvirga sp. 0TCS3.31]